MEKPVGKTYSQLVGERHLLNIKIDLWVKKEKEFDLKLEHAKSQKRKHYDELEKINQQIRAIASGAAV